VLTLRLEALQFIRPEHIEIPAHHRRAGWALRPRCIDRALSALSRAVQERAGLAAGAERAAEDQPIQGAARQAGLRAQLLPHHQQPAERLCQHRAAGAAEPAHAVPAGRSRWACAQGADDFLPVLVLVLLRAAPPQLASNLAYIARFRLASRLVSETSYFYTNLVSAAVRLLGDRSALRATHAAGCDAQTFLETAQASQFNGCDEAEFAARLRAKVRVRLSARRLGSRLTFARALATPQGLSVPSAAGSESGFSQPAPNTPKSIAAQRSSGAVNPFAVSPRGLLTGEASLVTRWTVEELSAVGEAMLASDAGDGGGPAQLARKYRFLSAAAGELTLSEVPLLLQEYGALAQRHEALLRGVALMLETSPTGPEQPSAFADGGAERGMLPTSASFDSMAAPDLIQLN